ncbi:MAG: hypothetical protein LBB75_07800, partial [Oscillospiraceae bacterium]|jgi:predicted nucleic acid-binding Zn ribbon protein|nr:hypothetical protein [Oscillospiraceae bacterium]
MDNKELTEYDESAVSNELPEEIPKEFKRVVQQSFSMMGITGPQESSLTKKMNEQHITQMLDNEKIGMELEAKDRERIQAFEDKEKKRSHWLTILIVFVLASLAAIVLILYKDQPDMVQKIIIPALTFIAGAGSGYGLGKAKRDS